MYPLHPVVSAEPGDLPEEHAFAFLRLHASVTALHLASFRHNNIPAQNFAIVTQAA